MTKEKKIGNFFSHPLVGIIGAIASIFSMLLAVYFYLLSEKYPELSYYVNPVKAIVVKSNQASSLDIFYNKNEIKTDITAVQVALWNNGKQTIRKENILKQIVIATSDKSPIIEITIRKFNRDVIGFEILKDTTDLSKIFFSWDIMEYNDWVILQLIYAGDTNTDIVLKGVIEGQAKIERYEYSGSIKSAQDQITEKEKQQTIIGYASILMGAFFLVFGIYFTYIIRMRKKIENEIEQYKTVEKDVVKVYMHREELIKSSFSSSNKLIKVSFNIIQKMEPLLPNIGLLLALGFLSFGLYFLCFSKISNLPFTF